MYLNIQSDSSAAYPVSLYYEDCGAGSPVVLIHGWPLSHTMWEMQVPALVAAGHRVISYDRRGFGDSGKPWQGYDYDTMAADLHALLTELDLRDVTLVGFSMGGGEVARYLGRYGSERIAKAVFLSSIAPYLLQDDSNPNGVPDSALTEFKQALGKDRPAFLSQFGKKFVNFEDANPSVSQEMLHYNWAIACAASPKATLDCVDAFGKTDLRSDVRDITIPVMFVHGDADQIVPVGATAEVGHQLLPSSRLEIITGAPHGCVITHAARVNELLIDFIGR